MASIWETRCVYKRGAVLNFKERYVAVVNALEELQGSDRMSIIMRHYILVMS